MYIYYLFYLLLSQYFPEQEALSQSLEEVIKATDEIETRIRGICEEVEGIEKVGKYVQVDALNGMSKVLHQGFVKAVLNLRLCILIE